MLNSDATMLSPLSGIYFYNGLFEPKLIASDLNQLKKLITLTDTYAGHLSSEVRGIIREELSRSPFNPAWMKEELECYDIFYHPTISDFQQKNRKVGLDKDAYLKNL